MQPPGTSPAQFAQTGTATADRSDGAVAVSVLVGAPRSAVWDVLADGFSYPAWVVGASHMRAVDQDWPARGCRLHHAVGAWPLLLRDSTEVEACEPKCLLVLLAHGRPIGEARVRIELEDAPNGSCLVTMVEDVVSTAARAALPAPVRRLLLRARNTESLARLAALVERRTDPEESAVT